MLMAMVAPDPPPELWKRIDENLGSLELITEPR
jgi:hypothetical protein